MFDSRRKQDWRIFVVFAILGGIFLVIAGVNMIKDTTFLPGMFMILLGIVLMIGSVVVFRIFFNTNTGKKDNSIVVTYQMKSDDGTETLDNLEVLKNKLAALEKDREILITLTPEYFGLVSWKFFKVKNQYLSFVTLRKKDKLQEYFIMPTSYPSEAIEHFAKVFEGHEAVNTSNLIELKRYKSVLEYYKLV